MPEMSAAVNLDSIQLQEQVSVGSTPASTYARIIALSDGTLHFVNDAGTDTDLTAGSGITSFDVTGDSGTPETVTDGETVDIAGGTGIDTSVAATNTVTVAIDSTVATLAGTQTLTNKTIDADGTGNTITNIGASEVKADLIDGQTTENTIDATNDLIVFYDNSASALRKTAITNLPSGGGSGVPNYPAATKTLISDVAAAGSDRFLTIAAESATSDDLVEITGLSVGDAVMLVADAGDTITVKHNSGSATIKILIQDDADFVLDEVHPLHLVLKSATELVQVYDENSGGASATGEIYLSGAGGVVPTTNGAASTLTEFSTNGIAIQTLDFDASADEYGQWAFQMPSDWDGGTVTATFSWTVASGSGDVVWGLQGRSLANDEAIDQSWGTAQTVTDTVLSAEDVHISTATGAITLAGTPAASELIIFRAFRDADNGSDTLAVDAKLIGITVTYTKS